jgi:hypothetical protein
MTAARREQLQADKRDNSSLKPLERNSCSYHALNIVLLPNCPVQNSATTLVVSLLTEEGLARAGAAVTLTWSEWNQHDQQLQKEYI